MYAIQQINLHPVFILFVSLLHIRQPLNAPAAPASPKVQHHIFASQRRKSKILPIDIFQHKLGSFFSFFDILRSSLTCFCLLQSILHGKIKRRHRPRLCLFAHKRQQNLGASTPQTSKQIHGNITIGKYSAVTLIAAGKFPASPTPNTIRAAIK